MYVYTEDDNLLFAAERLAQDKYKDGYKDGYKAGIKEFAKILKARIILNFVRTKRIEKLIDNLVEELEVIANG